MAVSETHLVLPTVQVFLLGFPCSFEVFSYHFVNSGTTAEILVQQQVPQLKWQISVTRMISFTIFFCSACPYPLCKNFKQFVNMFSNHLPHQMLDNLASEKLY